MAKFNFDAVGMAELLTNLDEFDQRMKFASKRALTEGAKVVLMRAKEFVQAGGEHPVVRTGTLLKGLKIGRRKSSRDGSSVEIGSFGGSAPHAHLVEFGHGIHNSTKSVPAHPFLEPAFDASKEEALEVMRYVMDMEGVRGE